MFDEPTWAEEAGSDEEQRLAFVEEVARWVEATPGLPVNLGEHIRRRYGKPASAPPPTLEPVAVEAQTQAALAEFGRFMGEEKARSEAQPPPPEPAVPATRHVEGGWVLDFGEDT